MGGVKYASINDPDGNLWLYKSSLAGGAEPGAKFYKDKRPYTVR